MLRRVLLGVAFIVVGALMFAWFSNQPSVVEAGPKSKHLYEAINFHIQDTLQVRDVAVTMIIPGQRVGDNLWRFTGSLQEQRSTKPFFGEIKLLCPTYEDFSCWRLDVFSVDGAWITVNAPGSGDEPQDEDGDKPKSGEEEKETDASPPTTNINSVENSAQTAKAINSQEDQQTNVFWRTVSDNINTRYGPDTSAKLAFKMPSHVKLRLKHQENGWGLFEYAGTENSIGEVWISMRLVTPYE